MKKVFILIILILFNNIFIYAQVPQMFNYQAGIYDANSHALSNHSISLQLSILDSTTSGPVLYSEKFTTTTDINGLFSVNLGNGSVISGIFSSIDWGNNTKWLKTEIDTTGGNIYLLMGITQFLSVPYALYAEKSKENLSGFGDWESGFQTNTVYKASSDGFLNIFSGGGSLIVFGCEIAKVFSDVNPNPSTLRAIWKSESGNFTVPIKKGDYWRVEPSACPQYLNVSSITWLPLR